jgi:hypothetical protein
VIRYHGTPITPDAATVQILNDFARNHNDLLSCVSSLEITWRYINKKGEIPTDTPQGEIECLTKRGVVRTARPTKPCGRKNGGGKNRPVPA